MKTIFLTIIFTVSTFVAFGQEKLSTAEVKIFKDRIEKETKNISSIQTDFVQQKHLAFLSNNVESKGKMFLNDKGALKWEYISPNVYSVVFKDNSIYINDNGKKSSIGGQDIFKKINHLIAGSVSGKLFDDKEFKIDYYKEKNDFLVKLIPLDKDMVKYIKEVNLTFPQNEATVSKVRLIEPSGDYTLIQFVNKKLNAPIDSSIFDN